MSTPTNTMMIRIAKQARPPNDAEEDPHQLAAVERDELEALIVAEGVGHLVEGGAVLRQIVLQADALDQDDGVLAEVAVDDAIGLATVGEARLNGGSETTFGPVVGDGAEFGVAAYPNEATVIRWTRHGSTQYLWTEAVLDEQVCYVVDGQGAPMAMFDGRDNNQSRARSAAE